MSIKTRSSSQGVLDTQESGIKFKSEDDIRNGMVKTIDKCIADGLIKTGSCVAVGGILSLVLFKRRLWPVTLAFGLGIGMAAQNCERNLNGAIPRTPKTED